MANDWRQKVWENPVVRALVFGLIMGYWIRDLPTYWWVAAGASSAACMAGIEFWLGALKPPSITLTLVVASFVQSFARFRTAADPMSLGKAIYLSAALGAVVGMLCCLAFSGQSSSPSRKS